MNAADILKCGLPWLRLDVAFDHDALLKEAEQMASGFVSHRSNGRGWKSICLHGISPTHTQAATRYGYESESAAPEGYGDPRPHQQPPVGTGEAGRPAMEDQDGDRERDE